MSGAAVEPLARALVLELALSVPVAAGVAALLWAWLRAVKPSAATRHVVVWLAIAAAAAAPFAAFGVSLARVEHRAAPAAPAPTDLRLVRAASRAGQPDAAALAVLAAAAGAAEPAPARAGSPAPFAAAAVALWLAIALWKLGRLGADVAAMRALRAESAPLDPAIERRLRRYRQAARCGRRVDVRVHEALDVPVAVGFRSPAILLPARVVRDEEIADLDRIALHEYAHLERHDDWTNLAQRVLERVLWFDPIVARLGSRLALERELACDDWVVARSGRAHRYASCLWRLAEASRLPARGVAAPGALFTRSQIATRIEALLDARRDATPRLAPIGASLFGTAALAVVTFVAVRAPAVAVADRAATAALAAAPAAVAAVMPDETAAGAATGAPAATPARYGTRRVDRDAIAACDSCDLRGADLRGLDLHGISLDDAKLDGADLRGADLQGTSFSDTSLAGALLAHADLSGAHLADCAMRGADLRGANLGGAELSDDDLTRADLRGASLVGTAFRDVVLTGARLAGPELRGAQLEDSDTSAASFEPSALASDALDRLNR